MNYMSVIMHIVLDLHTIQDSLPLKYLNRPHQQASVEPNLSSPVGNYIGYFTLVCSVCQCTSSAVSFIS